MIEVNFAEEDKEEKHKYEHEQEGRTDIVTFLALLGEILSPSLLTS